MAAAVSAYVRPTELPEVKPWSHLSAAVLPWAIRRRVLRAVALWIHRANVHFKPLVPIPLPTVSFDCLGGTAGQACFMKTRTAGGQEVSREACWHLRFNPILLMAHEDEFVEDIVPHEVAHLVAVHLFPRAGANHGVEWQVVMRALGFEPLIYHQLERPGPSRKRAGTVRRRSPRKNIASLKRTKG